MFLTELAIVEADDSEGSGITAADPGWTRTPGDLLSEVFPENRTGC